MACVRMAIVALLAAACGGGDSVRHCSIECTASGACPRGTTCLFDGFCHADDDPGSCLAADDAAPAPPAPDAAPGTPDADTCDDGIMDGDETATDCGGSCPDACDFAEGCRANADCASGRCLGDQTCDASVEQWTTPGSHTFEVPAGVHDIGIRVIGAGGGGGGGQWCDGDCHTVGGGGSGGYVESVVSVSPGESIVIEVGRGGAGGGGGTCGGGVGANGGESSADGMIATGGAGGWPYENPGEGGMPDGVTGSPGALYSSFNAPGGDNGTGYGRGGAGAGCSASGSKGGDGFVEVVY